MAIIMRLNPISHEEGRVRFVSRNATQGVEHCLYLETARWFELGSPQALAVTFEPFADVPSDEAANLREVSKP